MPNRHPSKRISRRVARRRRVAFLPLPKPASPEWPRPERKPARAAERLKDDACGDYGRRTSDRGRRLGNSCGRCGDHARRSTDEAEVNSARGTCDYAPRMAVGVERCGYGRAAMPGRDPRGPATRLVGGVPTASDPPWCKGSISDFGSDGPGSNPGGGAAGPSGTQRGAPARPAAGTVRAGTLTGGVRRCTTTRRKRATRRRPRSARSPTRGW